MRTPLTHTLVLAALVAGLAPGVASAAGGSSVPQGAPGMAPRTPHQIAADHYSRALVHRDKAWKQEEKAKTASAGERAKLEKKAMENFEKAARSLEKAVEARPSFHEAHSSLGYALRRLGDYEGALTAYNRALDLNPNYPEAIEYRGEAYLGLDRIEDAQQAYSRLLIMNGKRAGELLEAVEAWLSQRGDNPNGVGADRLEEAARWVEERRRIAATIAATDVSATGSW